MGERRLDNIVGFFVVVQLAETLHDFVCQRPKQWNLSRRMKVW
jgi:hypothetical protein